MSARGRPFRSNEGEHRGTLKQYLPIAFYLLSESSLRQI